MKVMKSLFLALALTIIGYAAVEAGAQDLIGEVAEPAPRRICCNFQVDCPVTHTCTPIEPKCSATKPHICVKNPTPTPTPVVVGVEPGETVP
jgi:hypothetical protein